jgi:hypothetical protein
MSIKRALDSILEGNLDEMRQNFSSALTTKAVEKLEERKIDIAKNYFGQMQEETEQIDELKGITKDTGARAKYMIGAIGGAIGAKIKGQKRKYKNRMKGLEGAKKKSEKDTENRKNDAANNETARNILIKMGKETKSGIDYSKIFKG